MTGLMELSVKLHKLATSKGQVVGEKNDYYVTLEQLDWAIRSLLGPPDSPKPKPPMGA
jgi:hypothetical protein